MKVGIFKRQPQKGANESLLVPPCGRKKTKKKTTKKLTSFIWQQMYSTKGCLTKFHLV